MTNEEIRAWLTEHAEEPYKNFTGKLIPEGKRILGVRIPALRKLAKQLAKDDWRTYLNNAWGDYNEELNLQGFVIGYAKADIEEILEFADAFIPKICDWSVNDGFCATFKIAQKNRSRVWDYLLKYKVSPNEFEQRVVAVMLMDHFLVDEYIDDVLEVWAQLNHEGYYVKMGVAWGYATAYAKYPDKTHAFLKTHALDEGIYRMAVQKMLESRRITDEQKAVLRRGRHCAGGLK